MGLQVEEKTDGRTDRHKARLAARGFSQQYGQDYDETSSPVARMVTLWRIISSAASKGWKLCQLEKCFPLRRVGSWYFYGAAARIYL